MRKTNKKTLTNTNHIYNDKCILFISKIIFFFINEKSFTLSNKMRLS